MKSFRLALSLPLSLLASTFWTSQSFAEDAASTPSAEAIIQQYLETTAVDSEVAFFELEVHRDGVPNEKYRLLGVYDQSVNGGEGYFLRVVRPVQHEGITVLATRDAEGNQKQYLYLPSVGKIRELKGNARSLSFLQSDFNYQDLVRELPQINHYELKGEKTIAGKDCYIVRAVENKDSENPLYGYRDLYIEKDSKYLLMANIFNPNGKALKVLTAKDYDHPYNTSKGKRPLSATMQNLETSGWSRLRLIESRLGESIDPVYFTPEKQESWSEDDVSSFIFEFDMVVRPTDPS